MSKSIRRAMAALGMAIAASSAMAGTPIPVIDLEFDEGSGATAVNSGSFGAGSNGTISGATYSADSAFGTGFSLLFDGDTDFVELPDSFDYGASLTLEAWIKPELVDGQRAIYDDYGNPGVFMAIVDGELEWGISTATHPGQGIAIFDGRICGGLWQHIAGTYDGSMLRAFVDGVQVGSVATSGSIIDNSGNATHIGADSATPSLLEFAGRIDGLRLYNDPLTFGEGGMPFHLCGELTGDCVILTTDALAGLQMAVGLREVDGAADVDDSGKVTAHDALEILRIAVGSDTQTNTCNGL